jgi:aspartate kinase
MSVILSTSALEGCRDAVINNICAAVEPESIYVEDGLALLAVVGRGMKNAKGVAVKIFSAITNADINIRTIDQGSSELNVIVGVDEDQLQKAMNAIYHEFVH